MDSKNKKEDEDKYIILKVILGIPALGLALLIGGILIQGLITVLQMLAFPIAILCLVAYLINKSSKK